VHKGSVSDAICGRLEPLICSVIVPALSPSEAAGVVHAANALVQALDLGGGPHAAVPRLLDGTWDGLRLTPEHLLAVCRETEGQFEEACQLLM